MKLYEGKKIMKESNPDLISEFIKFANKIALQIKSQVKTGNLRWHTKPQLKSAADWNRSFKDVPHQQTDQDHLWSRASVGGVDFGISGVRPADRSKPFQYSFIYGGIVLGPSSSLEDLELLIKKYYGIFYK